METKENDKIQNRREFFKQAAKKTLPVLAIAPILQSCDTALLVLEAMAEASTQARLIQITIIRDAALVLRDATIVALELAEDNAPIVVIQAALVHAIKPVEENVDLFAEMHVFTTVEALAVRVVMIYLINFM